MTPSAAQRNASVIAADRELMTRAGSLRTFVQLAWPILEKNSFVPGWHIDVICEHLEAVSAVQIRDLVINIPPGCGKSLLASVFWCAWQWIREPDFCWIVGSFDNTLCGRRDGGKIIALLSSDWFTDRWGRLLRGGAPSAYNFETTSGGFRFATSPGGRGTGRHPDCTLLDDPIKPRDATGAASVTGKVLESTRDWISNTLGTRARNPKTKRDVLIMQRLSVEDPTATVLLRDGVVHLCLPMRYVPLTAWSSDPRREAGELLYPARFDEASVKHLETQVLGPTAAAAQLQQSPYVSGGSIFKRADWRFWSRTGAQTSEPCLCDECWSRPTYQHTHTTARMCVSLPDAGNDIQSWDMTFKGAPESDYVAAGAWRSAAGMYFQIALLNRKMGFAATKLELMRWSVLHPVPAHRVIVENAANGPAIADEIGDVTLVTPEGGKAARAWACEPVLALGLVHLQHPSEDPGVWAQLHQCEAFPQSRHDDTVDQLTQAIRWYRASSNDVYLSKLAKIGGRLGA